MVFFLSVFDGFFFVVSCYLRNTFHKHWPLNTFLFTCYLLTYLLKSDPGNLVPKPVPLPTSNHWWLGDSIMTSWLTSHTARKSIIIENELAAAVSCTTSCRRLADRRRWRLETYMYDVHTQQSTKYWGAPLYITMNLKALFKLYLV